MRYLNGQILAGRSPDIQVPAPTCEGPIHVPADPRVCDDRTCSQNVAWYLWVIRIIIKLVEPKIGILEISMRWVLYDHEEVPVSMDQ